MKKQEFLEKVTKDDLLSIIKYGLRGSNVPEEITVEDIYDMIGCFYIEGK